MGKLNKKGKIDTIVLLSNSVCNLNCSFCFLHKNLSYKRFNEEIKEAWESKKYITNAAAVLKKLGSNLDDIKTINLWGGETLLETEHIMNNIEELFLTFKNAHKMAISSNWIINVNKFFDLLVKIDKYANKQFTVNLQLSIDGPKGPCTETGHNGSWDVYKKNILDFCSLCNNRYFEKVKVNISINSTVSKEVYFSEFSTYEGICNYVDYMYDFCQLIKSNCISRSIDICIDTSFPGLAVPYTETVEDGIKLGGIIRLWDFVWASKFRNKLKREDQFYKGITGLGRDGDISEETPNCSQLKNELTILPDGTVAICNLTYIYSKDYYREELLNEGNLKLANLVDLFQKFQFNPLKMTEKEIEESKWYIIDGLKGGYNLYGLFMNRLAEEEAYCGQIPYSFYEDHLKLMNHMLYVSFGNNCVRENIFSTGVYCIPSSSFPRRYLNGVSDSIASYKETSKKKNISFIKNDEKK